MPTCRCQRPIKPEEGEEEEEGPVRWWSSMDTEGWSLTAHPFDVRIGGSTLLRVSLLYTPVRLTRSCLPQEKRSSSPDTVWTLTDALARRLVQLGGDNRGKQKWSSWM